MPRGGGRGGESEGGGDSSPSGPVVKQRTRTVKSRRSGKAKRRVKSRKPMGSAFQIGQKKKKKKQEGSY